MSYEYNGTEHTATDMSRKFGNSWILLKEIGVVRIDNFDDDQFYYSVNDNQKVASKEKFEVLAEFPRVDIMVNHQKTCGLLSRIPRRQWTVGVTRNTISASNPAGFSFLGARDLTKAFVEKLFNPSYVDINSIYDAVMKDDSVAMAFNPKYWLCRKAGVELWRKSTKIGVITKLDKDVFNIVLGDFCVSMEQELKDEVKNVRFIAIDPV